MNIIIYNSELLLITLLTDNSLWTNTCFKIMLLVDEKPNLIQHHYLEETFYLSNIDIY